MENRSFKSRFICGMVSGVMAVTGAVSILPVLTSEQSAVVASATSGGAGGGTTGGGWGYVSEPASGEWMYTSGTPLGVRIYLAPRELVNQDKNATGALTGHLTTSAIDNYLHNYSALAYYAISAGSSGNGKVGTVQACASGKLQKSSGSDSYRLNGKGTAVNISKNMISVSRTEHKFGALFKSVTVSGVKETVSGDTSFTRWGSEPSDFYSVTGYGQRISNWSNTIFRDSSGADTNIDIFLHNYIELLKKSYTKGKSADFISKLPKNADEFNQGKWTIVVEPVFFVSSNANHDKVLALSSQDLSIAARTNGNSIVPYPCKGFIGPKAAKGVRSGTCYYSSYYDYICHSVYTKKMYTVSSDDLKGFALYWGSNSLFMGDPAKASMNYTLYNDTDEYKFNGNTQTTSQEQRVRDNRSLTVASSDTVKTALSLSDGHLKNNYDAVNTTSYNKSNAISNTKFLYFGTAKTKDIKKNLLLHGLDNNKYNGAKTASAMSGEKGDTVAQRSFQLMTGFAPIGSAIGGASVSKNGNSVSILRAAPNNRDSDLKECIWDSCGDDNYYLQKSTAVEAVIPKTTDYRDQNAITNLSSTGTAGIDPGKPGYKFYMAAYAEGAGNASNRATGSTAFGKVFRVAIYNKEVSAEEKESKRGLSSSGFIGEQARALSDKIAKDGQALSSVSTIYQNGKGKGSEYNKVTQKSSSINNVIGNSATAALSQSSINRKAKTGNNSNRFTTGQQTLGISANLLARKKRITTSVKAVRVDEEGNLHGMTVTCGSKSKSDGSILDAGYNMINVGNFTFTDVKKADAAQTLRVIVPKAAYNGNLQGIYDAVKASVEKSGGKLNPSKAKAAVKGYLKANGLDVSKVNTSNLGIHIDTTAVYEGDTYAIGANGGLSDTEIAGYDVLIYRDEQNAFVENVSANLEAYYVNFVFPTILGDTQEQALFRYTSQYVGMYGATTDAADSVISYHDNYAGSLITANKTAQKYILFNNLKTANGWVSGGLFGLEQAKDKSFSRNQISDVALTHSINLTREYFGDKVTVSSLNTMNRNIKNSNNIYGEYLSKTLSFSEGMKPVTRASGTVNKTIRLGTKTDNFLWQTSHPVITTHQNGKGETVYSYADPWVGTGGQTSSYKKAGYKMTETAEKYTPGQIGTSSNSNAGKVNVTKDNTKYSLSKIVGFNNAMTTFYPEVKMITHAQLDTSSAGINDGNAYPVYVLPLYVMGEKARSLHPSAMFTMSLTGADNANNFKGDFNGTPATGTISSSIKNAKDNGNKMEVVYSGSEASVATKINDTGIVFNGFVLDLMDKNKDTTLYTASGKTTAADFLGDVDLKSLWGSGSLDTDSEFKKFVSSITDNLYSSIYRESTSMKNSRAVNTYFYPINNKGKAVKTPSANTSVVSYNIRVQSGAVVKDAAYNELIKAIATAYNVDTSEAEKLFADSGMVESIAKAMETRKSSTNTSEVVAKGGIDSALHDSNGNTIKIYNEGEKWYDEEANYFVVRQYTSNEYKLQDVSVSSKLEYGAAPESNGDGTIDQAYKNTWYYSLGLDTSKMTSDGFASNPFYNKQTLDNLNKADGQSASPILIKGMKLLGASFLAGDETTNSMKN